MTSGTIPNFGYWWVDQGQGGHIAAVQNSRGQYMIALYAGQGVGVSMEPIDFVGALRRSWKLLIALALVGAVIAVLLPVSKVSKANKPLAWQASAVVGSVPASKGSLLGGGLTSQQIVFYATSNSVQKGTAVLAKIKAPSYGYYRYMEATLAAPGTTSLKSATGTTVPLKRNSATVV